MSSCNKTFTSVDEQRHNVQTVQEIERAVEAFVFLFNRYGSVEMTNRGRRVGAFAGNVRGHLTIQAPNRDREVSPSGTVYRP